MKFLAPIFCLFLALASCADVPVKPPAPPPTPAPVASRFVIIEYNVLGKEKQRWTVNEYTEKEFPPSVTFSVNGEKITLTGSYQINEFIK